jgi:iron complex outermembrane receptor protein
MIFSKNTALGFARLLTCALAFPSQSFAQTPQPILVVTGSRFEENLNEVPANVKVITRDEIANSTSSNIPDVLSQIGGLNVRSANGGQLNLNATVDMGGYGASANSNTLVLVDGQRINPIDDSGINWESIPIDSIERIEILQGGASVQYGNGAVGGVINIITNGGRSKLNQISASYGSFGTAITNAIIRDSVDQTRYQITANTANSEGWRQNSTANAYGIDAKITQSFGGLDKIYTDLFYAYTNTQNPGGVVGQVGSGNPQAAKFNNIGSTTTVGNSGVRFGGTKEVNSSNIFELDGSYADKSNYFYTPYSSTNNKLQGWQLNISPRIKSNWNGLATTVFGYEFNQGYQSAIGSYATSSAQLINQSGYVISRIPVTELIELSGGFRHQAQSSSAYDNGLFSPNGAVNGARTYSANAGDAALNFSFNKNQKTYIKWNQSYRFPNIDEYWGTNPNTYDRVFNGIIAPQITQMYELGASSGAESYAITASVFSSVTQNEITFNPSTGANYNSPYSTSRRGLLLDGTVNASKKITIAGGGKLQRSYYSNGPYAGNEVALAPGLLLNARINFFINDKWSTGATVNYVGAQHYDASQSDYSSLALMPAYTVADIFFNYADKNWETRLTIKNLGGANYATYGGYGFVSTPGGGGNAYYYYPSDPRSIYIMAKYRF